MFPWIPAAVGAVGGLISSAMGAKGQRDANQNNLQIAREQMNFQERMSNTSYQRQIADMKAAGLNPMLALNSGGASSPNGATAVMQNENASLADGVSRASTTAMEALRLREELKNMRESNRKIVSDTRLNQALALQSASQRKLNLASAQNARYQGEGLRVEADFDKTLYGTATRAAKRASPLLGALSSSARSLFNRFTSGKKVFDLNRYRVPKSGKTIHGMPVH